MENKNITFETKTINLQLLQSSFSFSYLPVSIASFSSSSSSNYASSSSSLLLSPIDLESDRKQLLVSSIRQWNVGVFGCAIEALYEFQKLLNLKKYGC